MNRLSRITVYETKKRYYFVGTDNHRAKYKILKLERRGDAVEISQDESVYTRAQVNDVLRVVEVGNKGSGGLEKVHSEICGILGFVRFTEGYYVILITARKQVAGLGADEEIYTVADTLFMPLGQNGGGRRRAEEKRYFDIFGRVDVTKDFYFSYCYDLTRSLQSNAKRPFLEPLPTASASNEQQQQQQQQRRIRNERMQHLSTHNEVFCESFAWNFHLLKEGFATLDAANEWVLPVIHGFVKQSKVDVFGRSIQIVLIARRSRHFAGARFMKRGTNDDGKVANEVESEQIVFDASKLRLNMTSYLLHRGSIPLYWSQDVSGMAAKPPISLNFADPFYTAAARHFTDLFAHYGHPVTVLNLVKQAEKVKREGVLADEFAQCIEYLNQSLPAAQKIEYIALDMSRAARDPAGRVLPLLDTIAQRCVARTGFYHSGAEPYMNALRRGGSPAHRKIPLEQSGVVRINCVDCLDRTNSAMFMMARTAFADQLYALGIILRPSLPLECIAVEILMEAWQQLGDTVAMQYGGSQLVNTMETYMKVNAWTNQSRDVIEAVKRWHSNSFTDRDKQDAINLFLGYYSYHKDIPPLWKLPTDFVLHNSMNHVAMHKPRRHYISWNVAAIPSTDERSQRRSAVKARPRVAVPFALVQFPHFSAYSSVGGEAALGTEGPGSGDAAGDGHALPETSAAKYRSPFELTLKPPSRPILDPPDEEKALIATTTMAPPDPDLPKLPQKTAEMLIMERPPSAEDQQIYEAHVSFVSRGPMYREAQTLAEWQRWCTSSVCDIRVSDDDMRIYTEACLAK